MKNRLTKKEIAECDGILVAADKNVEMARFEGKKVLKTSVSVSYTHLIPEGSKFFVSSGETDTPMISSEYVWTAVLTAALRCV